MTTVDSTVSGQETKRRHPLAACERCGLNDPKNTFVPTKRVPGATLAIVGEAPGFNESQTGEPFTGASGKLLNVVLQEHKIDRETAILTNACLCRPPDNRTPTTSEVKCCWPRLKADLEGVETIVTLGATASQVVLNTKEGVTKLRIGNPKTNTFYFPNSRIIPTFHPAACLRAGDYFPFLVKDIGKINGHIDEQWIEPRWKLADTEADAIGAIMELRALPDEWLVVDIEVGIDRDTHFGHADRYEWLCIGVSWAPDKALVFGEEALKIPKVVEALKGLFAWKKCIAHQIKFDKAGLGGGNFLFDTMLASYALDERPGTNSLDYCATEELGAPPWKHVIHQYIGKDESYANVPRDVLYKYCAFDAAAEFQLFRLYDRLLGEAGLRPLHDRLVRYSDVIQHMETSGLSVDLNYHRDLMKTYGDKIAQLDIDLRPWVANPRSWLQVKNALLDLGVPRVDSTDVEHLEEFQEWGAKRGMDELVEFIRIMFIQRKEAKLYGTYIKGLGKHIYEGRIHGSFSLHGTVTGRLAGKRPSLLNIPRGSLIKSQFVPDGPHYRFVQCDIRANELRVMAVESDDLFLREVLSDESRDIHNEVSLRFFGEGFTKEQRVRAKAVVYGLSYGREAYSLSMEFGIPVREAEDYLKTFFEVIPGVVEWKARIKHQVFETQEDLVTHFGRHRRFWLITRDNMKDVEKEAYAFIPQSTGSDINMAAAYNLWHDHGVDVRLTVHDSILAQVREEDADALADLMQKVVLETAAEEYSDKIPFLTDVAIGNNWGAV